MCIVQPLVPQRLPCYDFALVLEIGVKEQMIFFYKKYYYDNTSTL